MPKLNCVLRLPLLGLVLSLTVGIGVVNVQRVHGQTQPVPLVEGWSIELVAKEPQLVTPVGCRFDSSGNLYVVECHTHFPPDNYPGPKHDRIHRFRDADGNGSLETQEIYYEGGRATMGLAVGRDGWLYVATRSEVARIRDQDQDGKAEQREVLVRLETTADYPHNGLSAIVFGPDGSLFVGQGENFGQPYQLIGADGSVVRGGGEGGNVFRCTADGGKLERWATGFGIRSVWHSIPQVACGPLRMIPMRVRLVDCCK